MGFSLIKFEKSGESSKAENIEININLSCSKSGMQASLIRNMHACKCPSKEEAVRAELWNITGCGPINQVCIFSNFAY